MTMLIVAQSKPGYLLCLVVDRQNSILHGDPIVSSMVNSIIAVFACWNTSSIHQKICSPFIYSNIEFLSWLIVTHLYLNSKKISRKKEEKLIHIMIRFFLFLLLLNIIILWFCFLLSSERSIYLVSASTLWLLLLLFDSIIFIQMNNKKTIDALLFVKRTNAIYNNIVCNTK